MSKLKILFYSEGSRPEMAEVHSHHRCCLSSSRHCFPKNCDLFEELSKHGWMQREYAGRKTDTSSTEKLSVSVDWPSSLMTSVLQSPLMSPGVAGKISPASTHYRLSGLPTISSSGNFIWSAVFKVDKGHFGPSTAICFILNTSLNSLAGMTLYLRPSLIQSLVLVALCKWPVQTGQGTFK